MRVGVYVDAYNLYYGMRNHCGRGTAGWRWLDIRSLATSLCGWQNATIDRVVYCTARVDQNDDRAAFIDQDIYLKALKAHGSIDVLELGQYVARAKKAPLAARATRSGSPKLLKPTSNENFPPGMPLEVTADNEMVLATVRVREEKGSDVNVATHLVADVLLKQVDAAIVISNDSDLALPLSVARTMVPVGTVNPGTSPLAGALRGLQNEGPGGHWWASRLSTRHFYSHQMPDQVGRWHKPTDW